MNCAELCNRYLREHVASKKPRSQVEDLRQIQAYILPPLGAKLVADIQYEDVEKIHAAMKKTPYQANRTLALLSKIFSLAEKWRLRPYGSNPCAGIQRYRELPRTRYMSPVEAPRLAAALERHAAAYPQEVAFIQLLLLSGARPEEIARARWDWLELVGEGGVLRLPDSKTGARSVYLSPRLVRLLETIPITGGCILAGAKPAALWGLLRAEAGMPELRLYDLRHTFASAALAAGYSLDQIGALLGHKSTQTTRRYAHLMEEKAHEVAAGTSARLEEMLSPSAANDRPSANL